MHLGNEIQPKHELVNSVVITRARRDTYKANIKNEISLECVGEKEWKKRVSMYSRCVISLFGILSLCSV